MQHELPQDDRLVVEALREAGIEIESVYDLVNSKQAPPSSSFMYCSTPWRRSRVSQ